MIEASEPSFVNDTILSTLNINARKRIDREGRGKRVIEKKERKRKGKRKKNCWFWWEFAGGGEVLKEA